MKSETTISIVIVDDHAIFRSGLRLLLDAEPALEVMDECGNIYDAAKIIALKKPDIVLLELDLNDNASDGLELLAQLPTLSEKTNALVLTSKKDIKLHYDCLKLGANGLVLKDDNSKNLIEAISKVHGGELCFAPAIMGKMLIELARPQNDKSVNEDVSGRFSLLTAREREVINLVGEGLKNKAIADRLFISETTVRHHLTSIFNKLGVAGRLELVVCAFQNNLIEIPAAHRSSSLV